MDKLKSRRSQTRKQSDVRTDELWQMGLNTIKELEAEQGILASGKEEIYGCIFGRDSLITSIKLLKAYQKTGDIYFLTLVKKILLNISRLQGKESNIESGEELGKIIHEYRVKNHEHLTAREHRPWYLYPDNTMRNYDSVDSTPLFLMALSRYFEVVKDEEFFEEMRPRAEMALNWLVKNMESHICGFVSYTFPPERQCGGLLTQSWMDSHNSIFHDDDEKVFYPIAPVEVQGYAYVALRRWSRHLRTIDSALSHKLEEKALELKREFNKHFIQNLPEFKIAFALDGAGRPMFASRSSVGHLLWVGMNLITEEHHNDSILESIYVPKLSGLLFKNDIFEPEAGIRTLAKSSKHYSPMSYHNGSIWPHDNAIIAEGLEDFGYEEGAKAIRKGLVNAWNFFQTPIELFAYTDEGFVEYVSADGQKACTKQAWSAASMLSEL